MTDPTPPATLDRLRRDLRAMAGQTTGRRRLVYLALAYRVERIQQAPAAGFVCAQEAADERGVSRTAVRDAIASGRLNARKVASCWAVAVDDAYRRWLAEPIGPPQHHQ